MRHGASSVGATTLTACFRSDKLTVAKSDSLTMPTTLSTAASVQGEDAVSYCCALSDRDEEFLGVLGVTSQREIENAVREAVKAGRLRGKEALKAGMTLEIGAWGTRSMTGSKSIRASSSMKGLGSSHSFSQVRYASGDSTFGERCAFRA
jgi:hypothetical protein